jgi:hypothetical protein
MACDKQAVVDLAALGVMLICYSLPLICKFILHERRFEFNDVMVSGRDFNHFLFGLEKLSHFLGQLLSVSLFTLHAWTTKLVAC